MDQHIYAHVGELFKGAEALPRRQLRIVGGEVEVSDVLEDGKVKGILILRQQVDIYAERLEFWPTLVSEDSCQFLARVRPAFEARQIVADREELELEIAAVVLSIVVGEDPPDALGVELFRLRPERPLV